MATAILPAQEDREDYIVALKDAVSSVITDKGFNIPSTLARSAQQCAEKLLEHMSDTDNRASVLAFASVLIGWLKECLKEYKSAQATREKMWEKFFALRSDKKFSDLWADFLNKSISVQACPIFFQYVTESLMKTLIESRFSFASSESECSIQPLTYRESNSLRYMIGSIIQTLKDRVDKSSHPQREELMLCFVELQEDCGCEEDQSTEWMEAVDRGGLIHVGHTIYMLFVSIEMELRRFLEPGHHPELELTKKSKDVQSSDDVQFYWSTIAYNWGEREASVLLSMIVDHYITVRGFSFTSGKMEKHKKKQKKSVQKSKGLRKKLVGSNSDDKE